MHQDERELKREKRKQSNRESARRSRLRKQVNGKNKHRSFYLVSYFIPLVSTSMLLLQAEMEELSRKVDSLTAENMALRSEINKLVEDSEKIRSENATLMVPLFVLCICLDPLLL